MNDKKKCILLLLIFIFSFLAVRLQILTSRIFLTQWEELYSGTITREILKGLKMPLFDYQPKPFLGGPLIYGIIGVPFFKLFGDSYFSLKLIGLTFSLGSLIICFILINKHFGLKAATLTSLLFIFSPPLYTETTLTSWGSHLDSIFFSLLTILTFFQIFFKRQEDPSKDKEYNFFSLFFFGLISGFSIYFSYMCFYSFLTCLFFWYIFDKKFFLRKYFLIYCSSILIGFSPWLYYNITHSFRGIDIIAKQGIEGTVNRIDFFAKLIRYFSFDLSYILNFPQIKIPGIPNFRYFYYLILLMSLFFVTWESKDTFKKIFKTLVSVQKKHRISSVEICKESFFIVAFILFTLIYLFSGFETLLADIDPLVGHRYIIPLFPIFFIIIALFISKLTDNKKTIKKIFGYGILIILLILGAFSNSRIGYREGMTYFDLDGFSYTTLALHTYYRFGNDFKKYVEQGEKMDPDYKHFYYLGLGKIVNGRGLVWEKGFEEYKIFEKWISKIDIIYQSYYYEGIGFGVGEDIVYNQYKKPFFALNKIPGKKRYYAYLGVVRLLEEKKLPKTNIYELIKVIDRKYRKFFYPIWGKEVLEKSADFEKTIAFVEGLEKEEKEGVYKGLGIKLFSRSDFDINRFTKIIEPFPKNSRGFLYESAGEEVGFLNKNHISRIQDIIHSLSESEKQSVYKGIGRFAAERYGFSFKKYSDYIQEIAPRYRVYCYEGIGAQIALRFGGNPEAANLIINELPVNIRPSIERGFAEELT
ncbi:MAG: hypothetical protein A3C43_06625 [Candidatus Schekmanbacteria bacterium RIFCSPHIGHO2_02_FULL_38_11]|uniref:Glycosyltransferase RgtA/B/C/D-like domain-containing protein n=1 Tax=Candidatus Schekmanbacteria bacterium RIFCSPLOWO2_12_FULL_38_15 TaxID=1817883 RepID=A0A1F7SDG1_9BACT|nr:MAG: hypothetical protein A2043_07540 [Candidatus Schekmanbacteria bacterium GWA2_38_9]OGL49589.1 MAG: hypothetical protein A3C43_06625 [Candidatus Schekmanbacteria bacterium RIFCSPHIGHO2_02_FULL_38_11]OGL49981.1 MAG: hypothetical protein A3H37_12205 [Candidatus Schekmanbacteria bacterium RIFCSPLOWO2_02_FULL_38_14]OGL51819.1 MAG: hypothetical protein A3G31_12610 [Candidatus Schekmanbacteria bacterium RIFCSPLOWO2_12_FULL_38_15]